MTNKELRKKHDLYYSDLYDSLCSKERLQGLKLFLDGQTDHPVHKQFSEHLDGGCEKCNKVIDTACERCSNACESLSDELRKKHVTVH